MRVLPLLATLALAFSVAADPAYRDVTLESGIDFVHSNGATGTKQYPEVMGSGACLFDYDGDGRLDVYLVTSVGANRLYANRGGLRFEDVTEAAGVGDTGYGMGAVAADVDGDGDQDLFVTNLGENRLYENRGEGRFVERSDAAGLSDARWGCGATFLDADGDGALDLYLVNYVQVATPDSNVCLAAGGRRLYCPPREYPRARDAFYRNRGDGTFEDVTRAAGLDGFAGRGLGVVTLDYDRDGHLDLYVANDLDPNFLFRSRGDGTFEEVGMLAGVSHSEDGREESGMGVTAGDYDNDGWIDLFVTNYVDETNTLYHNERSGFFLDESATTRVGPVSLPFVGWGTRLFDFDLDGWLDIFVANGHTESDAEIVDPTTTWKQRDFLYRNVGGRAFRDVSEEEAPALLERRSGRGVAFGDLDDDGDLEILVVNQNDPPTLLANESEGRHWIGFRTVGTKSNRDGVGARVELYAGDLHLVREVRRGASYLSGNDPRVHFGLGEAALVDSVVVQWPSGGREVHQGLDVDHYHLLEEKD